jgi:uncharacterized membrane protein
MSGLLFCAASVSAQDNRAFYISFQVPGSLQTSPTAINNFSTVTGTYTDAKGTHGFVREALGRITTFDVPKSAGTSPAAINDDGMIVGSYMDSANVSHGFLRHPNGTLTRIDVPGSTSTGLNDINVFGAIVGTGSTSNGYECFVRSPQGAITVFGPNNCIASGINLFGAITGYTESPDVVPGGPPPEFLVVSYVRSPSGVITYFVAPNSTSNGTFSKYIDAFGGTAGFFQNFSDNSQNFLQSPQGMFTTITLPGTSVTAAAITGLNELGAVTGLYSSTNSFPLPQHGFVQNVRGVLTSFDFPGSSTSPTAINDFGVITGSSGNLGVLRVPY